MVPPYVRVDYEAYAKKIIRDIRAGRNVADVLLETIVVVHDGSFDQGASSAWPYVAGCVKGNMQDFVSTLEKEFIEMKDDDMVSRLQFAVRSLYT